MWFYNKYICVISVGQNAAKQAAAAATQTIAAAQNAASSNKNPAAQQQLVQSCKVCVSQHPLPVPLGLKLVHIGAVFVNRRET